MKVEQILSVIFALCLVVLTGCKDDPVYWFPAEDTGGGESDTGGSGETDTGGGESDTGGGQSDTGGGETDTEDAPDGEEGDTTDTADGEDADSGDGDGCPDEDGDGVCDDDDQCPGADDELCATACADPDTPMEIFGGGKLFGCVGQVTWPERDSLCGAGFRVAPAEAWVALRGSEAPSYNYWTDSELSWNLAHGYIDGQCSVGHRSMGDFRGGCEAGPMRVCIPASLGDEYVADPLGNTCTWLNCGWLDHNQNDYFGGCSYDFESDTADDQAGTLCVWVDGVQTDSVQTDGIVQSATRAGGLMGNTYRAGGEGRILTGFQQRINVRETTEIWAYVWKGTGQGDSNACETGPAQESIVWEPLIARNLWAWSSGVHNVGLENLYIDVPPGTYIAMGLGWSDGEADRDTFRPDNRELFFGELVPASIADNDWAAASSSERANYLPTSSYCDPATVMQEAFSMPRPASSAD